jgi:hypothetical protein
MKLWQASGFIICVALLNGCGNKPQPPGPTSEPAASATTTPAATPLPRTAAPAGARVSIVSPANGEKVKSPVTVKFAIEGISLAPAGSSDPNSGHHHLLVDTALPEAMGQVIPKDDRHLHFGKGQTETQIELPPGEHTLQLLLGDGNHVPHDPPVYSQQILITVE